MNIALREIRRSGPGSKALYWLSVICITLLGLLSFVPLVLMFAGSFTAQPEMVGMSQLGVRGRFTLDNYTHLFGGTIPIWRWFANSTITSAASALGLCLVGIPAGFVLAKGRLRGQSVLVGLLLVTLATPGYLGLIPRFTLVRQMGLANSLAGLIVPALVGAGGLFYFRQIMLRVPDDLLDAARIDGASEFDLLRRVVWPEIRPSVLPVAMLAFIGQWKEYVWPSILLADPRKYTLAVGIPRLASVADSTDVGLLMAGAVFTFVPVLIAFLLIQESVVRAIARAVRE